MPQDLRLRNSQFFKSSQWPDSYWLVFPPIRRFDIIDLISENEAFNSRVYYWKSFDKCTFCLYLIFNVDLQNFMVFTLLYSLWCSSLLLHLYILVTCHMTGHMTQWFTDRVTWHRYKHKSRDICYQKDHLIKNILSSKVS